MYLEHAATVFIRIEAAFGDAQRLELKTLRETNRILRGVKQWRNRLPGTESAVPRKAPSKAPKTSKEGNVTKTPSDLSQSYLCSHTSPNFRKQNSLTSRQNNQPRNATTDASSVCTPAGSLDTSQDATRRVSVQDLCNPTKPQKTTPCEAVVDGEDTATDAMDIDNEDDFPLDPRLGHQLPQLESPARPAGCTKAGAGLDRPSFMFSTGNNGQGNNAVASSLTKTALQSNNLDDMDIDEEDNAPLTSQLMAQPAQAELSFKRAGHSNVGKELTYLPSSSKGGTQNPKAGHTLDQSGWKYIIEAQPSFLPGDESPTTAGLNTTSGPTATPHKPLCGPSLHVLWSVFSQLGVHGHQHRGRVDQRPEPGSF